MWGRTEPCCSRKALACLRGYRRLRDTGRLTRAGSSPAARPPRLRAGAPRRRTPEGQDDHSGLITPQPVRIERGPVALQPRGSAQTRSPAPAHRVRGRSPMPGGKLSQDLGRLDPAGPRYATDVVEQVLAQARAAEASDVHLHPGADGLEVRWRIDGVLQPVAVLPSRLAASVVARLKVLAELLTYRTDVPRRGESGELPARSRCGSPRFPRCMARRPWCVSSQGRAGSSALPTWGCPPRCMMRFRRSSMKPQAQGRVDKPNCLTPRSGADCLNLDIRRQGFGPKPRSLSGYLHPSHIHGRSICTACLDSATMLVRPNSSGLMHHGGARICMVVVRTTAPGTPSSAARSRLRREMRCPKTTWCSSCWISSRRSISRPSTSITPKSCAANRLST